jgi:hypothetical protein
MVGPVLGLDGPDRAAAPGHGGSAGDHVSGARRRCGSPSLARIGGTGGHISGVAAVEVSPASTGDKGIVNRARMLSTPEAC